MAILSKAGITSGSIIQPAHVTQIIDALTASGSTIDILITGSLSVEGITNLGKLGKNTQSPLIFNPDAQGNSVFYAKNPSGTLTIGTGANPYAGSDLLTLSPLGALGVVGINVGFTASAGSVLVSGNTGLGTSTPLTRLSVSNNGSQSIEMDYSVGLNANYIESINRSSSAPLDLVYFISTGTTGSHRFYTNGSQKMVINRDGNVGIGTTAPTVPLNVSGDTIITGSTILFNNGGTLDLRGTNHSYIQWYPDNSTRRAYFGFAASGSTNIILENENASGNIAIVTNGGFIGINKYVPTSPLDVNGNATVTGSITATSNITSTGIISSSTMTTTNFTTTNFSASGIVTIGTPGVTNASHIQFYPNNASGNAYYIEDFNSIFSIGGGVYGSGTSVLSINGSNNVGIGKTTPTTKLDVNGNTTITGSLINRLITNPTRTNPHIRLDYSSSTADPQTDQAIGIIAGYTSKYNQYGPYIKFVAQGNWTGGQYPAGIEFYTQQQTGGTEKLTLSLNQNGVIEFNNYTSNGTVTTTGANGTISVSSDKNLKTADGFIENGIEKVMALKPRYFYWKPSTGFGNTRQLGFYAQEVNSVSEEAANTPATGQQWGIYDRGLIAILTKAVQEQQTQIEELKLQVATLINGSL